MIKKFFSVFFLASITSITFAKGIPKQFQGTWKTLEGCKKPVLESDYYGTKIGNKTIVRYEQGCKLKQIIKSDMFTFSGIFICESEGEFSTEKTTLTLRDGKLFDGNNSSALSRCNR